MANEHIPQAQHNQLFYNHIQSEFPIQFGDWKITVLFYIAIHYLQALADHRGIDIGCTHYDIEKNVNPNLPNAKMRITRNAWRCYRNLFQYSKIARYDGFVKIERFNTIQNYNHLHCMDNLEHFRKYIEGQGVELTLANRTS